MKKKVNSVFIALFCLCFSYNLFANDISDNPPFKLNPLNDGIILGVSGGLAGSAFLYRDVFHAKENNFVQVSYDKADVNGFDQIFMRPYSKTLHIVGTGTMILSMASPFALLCTPNSQWFTIGTMFAETLLLAQGTKEWIKNVVYRPRPYVYFDGYPQDKVDEGDWNCSFPSGHATMAFAGAAFLSYVFCQYYPESSWKYAVTGISFGIAALTGALRMASGNHYFTDVLVGALIGTSCGFLVPFMHTQNYYAVFQKKKVQSSVSPLGFNVKFNF